MPAISVARTDTFEQQRLKINQIGDQIFNVTAGGSDLSTGNLKLGDGTLSNPSLGFVNEPSLGLYRPELGVIAYVSSNKLIYSLSQSGFINYRDFTVRQNQLQDTGIAILNSGANYDPGSYSNIPLTGGTGENGTADITVIPFNGTENQGADYSAGSFSSIPLVGGSTTTRSIVSFEVENIVFDITDAGSGYTDGTYQNVPLTNVSGSGTNAEAEITISGGFAFNGTITGGSGYSDGNYFSIPLYTQPVQTFVVTVTGDGVGTPFEYDVDGSSAPALTLVPGNTYRFDTSDSSNQNHSLYLRGSGGGVLPSGIRTTSVSTSGNPGSFFEVIVDPAYSGGSVEYSCVFHQTMGGDINFTAGAAGSYGYGATADIDVSGGAVTSLTFDLTGTDIRAGDVLEVSQVDIGAGTGFEFTINSIDNNGTVVFVQVTTIGQNYANGDILSFNPADVGGTGSGAELTITSNPGQITNFSFDSQASDYTQGDVLTLPGPLTGVTTTLSGTDGGLGTPSTTFTVADVSNIINGSVVTQTAGTGALNGLQDTLVTAVDYDNNTVTVDVDPDTSGSATLTFTPPYGDATTDFTFTIDNVGPIDSVSISNPGVGYFVGDVLSVNALNLVQPITYYVRAIQVQHLSFAAATIPAGTFSVGDGFKFPDGTPTSVTISTSSTVISGADTTYPNVSASGTSGNGSGETFTITRDSNGEVTSAVPDQAGFFYETGDTVTIPGADVGGSTPADNIVLTIDFVTENTVAEVYSVIESGGFTEKAIVADGAGFGDLSSFVVDGTVNPQYVVASATTSGDKIAYSLSLVAGVDNVLPNLTLLSGNTYNFDTSDSSNSSYNFNLSKFPGGSWGTSLVENVSTTVDLSVASTTVTVASTTGIVADMEVFVDSGTGVLATGTTVVSVDSSTTLTLSTSPTTNGDAVLTFRGAPFEDGVSLNAGVITIQVSDTTPTLYYYNSNQSSTNNADAGGLPGNEATLSVDTNNPKVFGSGFELSVSGINSVDIIGLNVTTGVATSQTVNTTTVNATSVNASTSVTTDQITANTLSVSTISSTNLNITGASASFGGDVTVGAITLANTSGNISTSGNVTTTSSFNSNNQLYIQDNEIKTFAGYDLELVPFSNQIVKVDTNTALVIPSGNTSERPLSLAQNGAIRFNTETNQYEGYSANSTSWSSLGGVRDLDGNTYILAEASVGANDNTLYFYNDGINTLKLTPSELDFQSVKTLSSTKTGLPSYVTFTANTPYNVGDYIRFGNNLYEVTQAGTSGTSGPTHTTGTESNGSDTLLLLWYSLAVDAIKFESVREVQIDNSGTSPLIVNNELLLQENKVTTKVSDLVLQPNSGKKTVVSSSTSLVLPTGSSLDRGVEVQGAIRFSTSDNQFEGYDGNNWGSLGGVKDVDQNTYIIPETAPGANENILYFYNDGDNTVQLTTGFLDFYSVDTIRSVTSDELEVTASLLTIDQASTTIDNTAVDTTFLHSSKQYFDIGLSAGINVDPVLRLDNQGDVFLNVGFGTGTFDGVKIFDGDLKEFELADIKIVTDKLVLTKGTVNNGNSDLYNTTTASGCKTTVVAENPTTGEREFIEFGILDNGTDVYHTEYGNVRTGINLIIPTFELTTGGLARINIEIGADVNPTETVNVTFASNVTKK